MIEIKVSIPDNGTCNGCPFLTETHLIYYCGRFKFFLLAFGIGGNHIQPYKKCENYENY